MEIEILAIAIFIAGYAIITLEHMWGLHKAITAAALGASMWLLIGIKEGEHAREGAHALGGDIFGLIIFLMAAMMLVEILIHYGLFDLIRAYLFRFGFNDYKQLWVIATLAFFLSAIIDNLTTTIVMTQISLRFFRGKNLLIAVATVVISANTGGAWSPIGDITTIMLWLAGKFSSMEIIIQGFLPALALFFVSTFIIARGITNDTRDIEEEKIFLAFSEKMIIGAALASFSLPLVVSRVGLEPYFGLLFGAGIVGTLIWIFRRFEGRQTHLDADLEKILHGVDFASLLFFAGILLAIGALEHLGILEQISERMFGHDPAAWRVMASNTGLGVLSAIVDNIPLTAAAIEILKTGNTSMWILLALTVGTGGSLLVIGSAAGVVAMGMVKELSFFTYIKIATIPALVGYIAAISVWYTQYIFFFS